MIADGVPKLSSPDREPTILLNHELPHAELIVTRDGDTKAYKISRTVAAELIASGFSHGS